MKRQAWMCVAALACGLICSTAIRAQQETQQNTQQDTQQQTQKQPKAETRLEKGYWRASSSSAKSITGDVGFSSEKMSINFANFWIAQIRRLKPAEISAAFDAPNAQAGSGDLYRVSIPGSKRFLHKNTLCGGEDVQWVAAYSDGHELQLALFSGSKMPEFTPDALGNGSDLCGTYAYVK